MTICLPLELPAPCGQLDERSERAASTIGSPHPDALRLALVDLTFDPAATLRGFARLLPAEGPAPRLTGLGPADGWARGLTPAEACQRRFDALVVTATRFDGESPRSAAAWRETARIFDWAESQGLPSLFVGAAARGALWCRHGIRAGALPRTLSGIVAQRVLAPASPFLDGLDPAFPFAVCRTWALRPEDLPPRQGLGALACSALGGLCLIEEPARQSLMLLDQLPSALENQQTMPSWGWQTSARQLLANWLAVARRRSAAAA